MIHDTRQRLSVAQALSAELPTGRFFAGEKFRVAPEPFTLSRAVALTLEPMGRHLLHFYRAANLIYRRSVLGEAPAWVADYLDRGKPARLVELSRRKKFNGDLPVVLRPDLIMTPDGLALTELDSVPGGVGLTGFLNTLYAAQGYSVVGGPGGMTEGFGRAVSGRSRPGQPFFAVICVSEEAATYRPEMEWLVERLKAAWLEFELCTPADLEFPGDGVFFKGRRITVLYRFFELFDLPQIPQAGRIMEAMEAREIEVTPPFKPQLEEKMWFALFRHPALRAHWHRELGDRGMEFLETLIPPTVIMDPAPLPPQGVFPVAGVHEWSELASFSQKERDFIIKISGFSEKAWGSRGVYYGRDLPTPEWSQVVREALDGFSTHPHLIQRFRHSAVIPTEYLEEKTGTLALMPGRVRLCPYFFVTGDNPELGGILATVCPADKKILHGMDDAILSPCRFEPSP
ncbi:MAG: hypothetical protein SFY92_11625 [Verrucomicrobiae bacterium]|nr:hypothetical protein [Verrucomicrobiae bacterium]